MKITLEVDKPRFALITGPHSPKPDVAAGGEWVMSFGHQIGMLIVMPDGPRDEAIAELKEDFEVDVIPTWPALDDELRTILGMPNFQAGPMAQSFRAAGADIPHKSEAEQAYILHWLVGLYMEHGKEWRKHAADRLSKLADELKAIDAKSKG